MQVRGVGAAVLPLAVVVIVAGAPGCCSPGSVVAPVYGNVQPPPPATAMDASALAAEVAEIESVIQTRLSVNPFGDAKVGDWWTYAVTLVDGQEKEIKVKRAVATLRIAEVLGDDVLIETTVSEGKEKRDALGTLLVERHERPLVVSLIPIKELTPFRRIASFRDEAATRENSPAAFAGTRKISFAASVFPLVHREPSVHAPRGIEPHTYPVFVTLWIDAKAIYGLSVRLPGFGPTKLALELAGRGTRDGVDWGKRPGEVLPEAKETKDATPAKESR